MKIRAEALYIFSQKKSSDDFISLEFKEGI